MDRIEEIRERVKKMPPGPYWTKQVANGTAIKAQPRGGRGRSKDQTIALVHMHNDGEHEQTKVQFIAHAREDIPFLLAEIERLQKENQRLTHEAEGLHSLIQQAIHPQSGEVFGEERSGQD